MKVSLRDNKPLHIQAKEIICREFLDSAKPGDKLPTELELAKKLKIGRKPVRKAFDGLRRDGILNRKAGIGTFYIGKGKTCLNVALFDDIVSFDSIFDLCQETVKDLTFRKINLHSTDAYAAQVSDMISRNEVDIIHVTGSIFRAFDVKNKLMPLNSFARKKMESTYEFPWGAFKDHNSYYALPLAFSPVVMAYRKDLFDEMGVPYPADDWSWNDFLEKALRLSCDPKNIMGKKTYGYLFIDHINRWPAYLYQNGGSLRDREGRIDISSAEDAEAINFIYDLIHKWRVAAPGSARGGLIPFLRAKIAMSQISYAHMNILDNIKGFEWDIAPLPSKKNRSSVGISYGFAAAENSRNREKISEFFNFCHSEAAQQYIASTNTVLPVVKKFASEMRRESPANHSVFRKIIPDLIHLNIPYRSAEEEILADEMTMLWNALQTYDETCKHIRKRLYEKDDTDKPRKAV